MARSAERFAAQWRDTEHAFYQGLRSPKRTERLLALQKAAGHFIIARNFSRAFDVRLGAAYGKRALISAASKLLWLAQRSPAIIYDSRACRTLQVRPGNYETYITRWREEYAVSEPAIIAACARLTTSMGGSRSEDVGAPWFAHRVFDVYLYDSGAPS